MKRGWCSGRGRASISGSIAAAAPDGSWLFTLPNSIVGLEIEPDEQTLDARWLMAYNAALGELSPEPHPLFPVCYEWPATRRLREHAGLAPLDARLVHAQHDLTIHRAP